MKFRQHLLESATKESHDSLSEANIVFDKLKQIQGVTSSIDTDSVLQIFKDAKSHLATSLTDVKASDFKIQSTRLVTKIEIAVKSFLNFKHIIKTEYLDDSITALAKLMETIKQYTNKQIKAYHSTF